MQMILLKKLPHREEVQQLVEVIQGFQPMLKDTVKFNFHKMYGDTFHLSITNGNRACALQGNNGIEFFVEGSLMLNYYEDIEIAASLIKYWLVDNLMPSQLKSIYPNLNLGELSNYYENGDLIRGEFILSWKICEGFIDRPLVHFNEVKKEKIKTFLREMRQKYNETTRAGVSMLSLVLTRARWHGGMGGNTPFVSFYFFNDGDEKEGMLVSVREEGEYKTFEMPTILDSRLEQVMDKLIANEVK